MKLSANVDSLPNGMSVLWGGTRGGIQLNRPWQSEITVDPTTCPFDNNKQHRLEVFRPEKGWQILPNSFTPYPVHYLIIPGHCWEPNKVRYLGGKSQIAAALRTARQLLDKGNRERWLGVHVGPAAGQNIGHLHYHLLQPIRHRTDRASSQVLKYCESKTTEVLNHRGLRAVVAGSRAGQCFIHPTNGKSVDFTAQKALDLAAVLARLVELYNRKFISSEGLPPDFMLGMMFTGKRFVYAFYLPILNNWGFTEYFALLERTPFTLPWSHNESAAHLLSMA